MPNFSGKWGLTEQLQAVAAGTWTGLPAYELYAWGSNSNGQIGDGTIVDKSSPVQIGSLTNWAQVSSGGGSCGALKTDGTLWTWGVNNNGNLGLGNVVYRSSPVQVGALTNWQLISVGSSANSAAIKTDGTLWNKLGTGFGGNFVRRSQN